MASSQFLQCGHGKKSAYDTRGSGARWMSQATGALGARIVQAHRRCFRESLYMSSRSFLEALLLCIGIFQCHPQSQVPMTQPLCTPPSRSQEQVGIETKICLFEKKTAFSLVQLQITGMASCLQAPPGKDLQLGLGKSAFDDRMLDGRRNFNV